MFKHAQATVLVIEDDAAICKSLSWLFDSVNLKVKIYSNPDDYLKDYAPNLYIPITLGNAKSAFPSAC